MLCSICLCDCCVNGEVIRTWCKHLFHASCLNRALQYRSHCPMCRSLLCPTVDVDNDDTEELVLMELSSSLSPPPLRVLYFRQFGVIAGVE